MQRNWSDSSLVRFSLFDPPVLTVIVYGGVSALYFMGELNNPVGRMLAIPAILGVVLVPIFTFRALGQTILSSFGGGKLIRFTSGVLHVERIDEKLRLSFNTQWRRYSGATLTSPEPNANIRRWVTFRELGSFLGIVTYAGILIVSSPRIQSLPVIAEEPDRQQFVATMIFGLSVLIITLGVWQLINRQLPRIWRMWRRRESAQREASIIAMTAYLLSGLRPESWNEAWPRDAAWDGDDSVEGLYGYRFYYLHALDTGDFERANHSFRHIEEHSDRLPGRLKEELVMLERPFVEAVIRGNPAHARELLDEIEDSLVDPYRVRRVQAAVALAEGEWQAARNLAAEGIEAASQRLDDGEVQFELALLRGIMGSTAPQLEEATAAQKAADAQAVYSASHKG